MFNYDSTLSFDPKKAISRLIAFFDLFEYPLTPLEVWHYLDRRIPLTEIMTVLDNLYSASPTGKPIVSEKNGFYFLAGREEIVITRQKRHNYSQRKVKIAQKFSRLFSFLPTVRMVAVANSLGQYNLRDESDIDFFIITTPHRLWLSRFFCAGLAKILNRRPTRRTKRDKICLSFYISTEHLNISDLALGGNKSQSVQFFQDPYFYCWQRGLILLYNKKRTYESFLVTNQLIDVPNGGSLLTSSEDTQLNFLGNWLEKMTKKIQQLIMPMELKGALNNNFSSGVVINSQVLKLYQHDRRQEFLEKYEQKIQKII